MDYNTVVLVDKLGTVLGTQDKLKAHQLGQTHLAFSVFLYRLQGPQREFLLQRRADSKYHSGGLWSNTVCSHPLPNEALFDAAQRRLKEEMGIIQPIQFNNNGAFHYRAELENGLIEDEYDHLLLGLVNDLEIAPVSSEVSAIAWVKETDLIADLQINPNHYTAWLPLLMQQMA